VIGPILFDDLGIDDGGQLLGDGEFGLERLGLQQSLLGTAEAGRSRRPGLGLLDLLTKVRIVAAEGGRTVEFAVVDPRQNPLLAERCNLVAAQVEHVA
jgi:hypothetical protein